MSQTRRLAAILAADVAGYSRLMGADEEGTLERLKALRRELLDPQIAEHRGRLVKTTGDSLLVEFASVVDAVRCAVAVQQAMPERDIGVGADNRVELRIGINLGDVIVEGDDLYGDGVNIAARIEALADAGGVFVSNTFHDHVRDRLSYVFEDLGEQQVKNIARPVRVYRVRDALTHPAAAAPGSPLSRIAGEGAERQRREAGEGSSPALPLPDKPSIAVLPFANMSGDPEQEYFADGMVEEIITALSRIRWLFVIARNSSFTYKGQAVDVKQIGRELGVRYVLEGSVRKAGQRVRITAQLIDALSGTHLWADRFDGSLEDVFDLQDKVASSVAGIIEPALQAAETARSAGRPTNDLTAYDLYLRAYAMVLSSARQIPEALRLMEQAIARDPRYGPALAWAALSCHRLLLDGRSEDPAADRLRGADFARRALELAGDDPGILANAALALAYFGEDIGAMMALVDRALALNPNFARRWHISGLLRLRAGQPDIAIEHVETSLRLSPRARVGQSLSVIGFAHFFAQRFDEAMPKLLLAIEGDDLYGDGVNIAARVEAMADAGGVFVSNTVHDHVRDRLPFVFEDLGEQQVKNIARPVRVYRVLDAGATKRPSAPAAAVLPLPDKPSIAVLPFANMSGDPGQEYFVDGMVEEIITALSRIRWLFVLSRNSSFSYKGQSPDVKRVGRELGVRYVLEGSVRKAGNHVRITGQLIDAETGSHLWADRFDGSLEDVFELQDKVASSVAGVIEPALQAAETARSADRPTADLTAYDLYLRASAMILTSARQIPEALRLLERAIERDPRYGPALAWAAFCCFRLLLEGRSEDLAADRLKGVDFARRALEVAGEDPGVLTNAAFALAYFGEDIGAMMALVDRALTLNPSYARGWHISGALKAFAGQPDIAIEHVEAALRLSPRARIGTSLANLGFANFLNRRFDEAVPKLLLAIQDDPGYATPYQLLAACYAHMGRLDDAREVVARLRAITPVVIPDASFLRNADHRELWLSGLRLAAGEVE